VLNEVTLTGELEDLKGSHKLEELIEQGRTATPIAHAQKIAKAFPFVKKLRLQNANDTVLRIVFKGMQNLQELVAEGNFTDYGINGLDEREFKLKIINGGKEINVG